MNGKPRSREPNKVLMYQKHMPYSQGPTFKLADEHLRTWWSFDGQRLMLEIVCFMSILNKNKRQTSLKMWQRMRTGKTKFEKDCFNFATIDAAFHGTDIMDMAHIVHLLVEGKIPYRAKFPKEDADAFRNATIASMVAFEKEHMSNINAAHSAPYLAMKATKAEDAASAAASIAQQAPATVINDTESDSD
jgi:hypothetical protein